MERQPTDLAFADRAEGHRRELHVHCYRMLGSFDDAEDLVQETMLRAWHRRDHLRDGDNFRAWLYKIATHACLDAVKAKNRRVPSLSSMRDIPWLEPYPDRMLELAAPEGQDPPAVVIARETIELTFLAVIQLLPARQRAVVILRDVLDWPIGDVVELLELSPAAVNSALQRARTTLRNRLSPAERDGWAPASTTAAERDVLGRYIRAYEDGNSEATLSLVSEDVRVTMPPAPYLFEGRDALHQLARRARSTGEWLLVATGANRQPAAACYLRDPETHRFRAFKVDVLFFIDWVITEIYTFGYKNFAAFGLPLVLPEPSTTPPSTAPPSKT